MLALGAPRATTARGRQRWQEPCPLTLVGDADAAPGGRKETAPAVVSAEGCQRAQVVSSLLAGAAVGSLGGSGLADSFGRRTTLLLDAVGEYVVSGRQVPSSWIWRRLTRRPA